MKGESEVYLERTAEYTAPSRHAKYVTQLVVPLIRCTSNFRHSLRAQRLGRHAKKGRRPQETLQAAYVRPT